MQLIREAKYTEVLDNRFKKFLDGKKSGKTPKERMDMRAGQFVSNDLVNDAKKYTYVFLPYIY